MLEFRDNISIRIEKFDEFNLDVNLNKGNGVKPKVFGIIACIPGTCNGSCHGDSTMYSKCYDLPSQIAKTTTA